MYFLYSVLTAAGMLLLLPYFVVQGLRSGKYLHNVRERLGWLPANAGGNDGGAAGAIWVHAVSVGEALAAVPLARRLKEHFPERRLVVSTTTATGQRLARERLPFADAFFYFPLDWRGPVRRVLRAVRPSIVVVVETEIWPNFLREARRAGVPVVFVNGRISERSFRRYRWVNGLLRGSLARVLSDASLFLMQTDADAERVRSLGAPCDRVIVTGNLKYDVALPAGSPILGWLESELERRGRGPVIVAGSLVAGEESLVLIAFGVVQGQWPRALLVLAPRKPERFDVAARLVEESDRRVLRRSQLSQDNALQDSVSVLLLDSVGELAGFYGLADAVFVGGSLVPSGGHNILEPACFDKPPLFGPSMQNFREMAALFLQAGAAIEVHSPEELADAWISLLQDKTRAAEMGRAARELVERNRGATERTLAQLSGILSTARSPV